MDAPREKCQEGRGPGARPHLHSTGDQWRRTLKGQWKGTPRVGGGTRGVGGRHEGNASRKRPRSMSNSKGKSNKIRTENYALRLLRNVWPLAKGRVGGEVRMPATSTKPKPAREM